MQTTMDSINLQPPKTASKAIAGLEINSVTTEQFQLYINLVLSQTEGVQTLSFFDAKSLYWFHQDEEYKKIIRHFDYLVPRGKGIRVTSALQSKKSNRSAHSSELYRELLLSLEAVGETVLLFTDDKKNIARIENEISKHFPCLNLQIVLCDVEYDKSTHWFIQKIEKFSASAVLFAIESPLQERLIAKIEPKCSAKLLAGLGYPFFNAIFEVNDKKSLARFKNSILLSPIKLLQTFISSCVTSRFEPSSTPSKINKVLNNWGWSVRLTRISIRLKASLWLIRCRAQGIIKRGIDLLGSSLGLLFLMPILVPVALGIKATSPGPLFYSQVRVGHRGKLFRMWKFRSMYIDADARKAALMEQNESSDGVIFKMKKDPRITPIGRIIRRLSIDELPQLYNVLTGEMSLVGPRPALESEVAQYPVLARARLEAMPGLTGLWQISGRSDLPFDKQVLLDTAYVNQQSAINDVKLIAKTIPAVVSGKGAY